MNIWCEPPTKAEKKKKRKKWDRYIDRLYIRPVPADRADGGTSTDCKLYKRCNNRFKQFRSSLSNTTSADQVKSADRSQETNSKLPIINFKNVDDFSALTRVLDTCIEKNKYTSRIKNSVTSVRVLKRDWWHAISQLGINNTKSDSTIET